MKEKGEMFWKKRSHKNFLTLIKNWYLSVWLVSDNVTDVCLTNNDKILHISH